MVVCVYSLYNNYEKSLQSESFHEHDTEKHCMWICGYNSGMVLVETRVMKK